MTDFLKMTFGTGGREIYLTCLGLFLFIFSIYKLIDFLKETGKFHKNFTSTMKWVAGFVIAITILQPRTRIGIRGEFNEVAIYRAKFQTDWLIASAELLGSFLGLMVSIIIVTYLIRLLLPVFRFIHKKTNEGQENVTSRASNIEEMKASNESYDVPDFFDTPLGYFLMMATIFGAIILGFYLSHIGVQWWVALIFGILFYFVGMAILDMIFQKKSYQEEPKIEAISKSEITSKPTKSFPWWFYVLLFLIFFPSVFFMLEILTEFTDFHIDNKGDLIAPDGTFFSFRWLFVPVGVFVATLITIPIFILIMVIFKKDWRSYF